jgi:hypothetical protein
LEPNEDLKHTVLKKTESDLLKKLKNIAIETNEAKEASEVVGAGKKDLSSLFTSLKVVNFELPALFRDGVFSLEDFYVTMRVCVGDPRG